MRTLMIGVLVSFLMVSVSGCSMMERTEVVTKKEVTHLVPPMVLLGRCPEPRLQGSTNEDLGEWALKTRHSLRQCNAQLSALRMYYMLADQTEDQ